MKRLHKFLTITFVLFLLMVLLVPEEALAQGCVMCRQTLESNRQEHGNQMGGGINAGILYVMVVPYLLLSTVAILWYRNSKKTREQRLKIARALGKQV